MPGSEAGWEGMRVAGTRLNGNGTRQGRGAGSTVIRGHRGWNRERNPGFRPFEGARSGAVGAFCIGIVGVFRFISACVNLA